VADDASAWDAWVELLHAPDPDAIEILRCAAKFQRYFQAVEDAAVKAARRDRASWEQIGQALGVTRQAAWEKYATSDHKQLQGFAFARFRSGPPS
jgi:hypothetical protein